MTHLTLLPATRDPNALIEEAIARFGARRVLLAAALAVLRPSLRSSGVPSIDGLSDRLRRDVGLPPAPDGRLHPWP